MSVKTHCISLFNNMNWWQKNALTHIDQFKQWIGDHTKTSRVMARKHIREQNHQSILDVGCAICIEAIGFMEDGYKINYHGVDTCQQYLDLSQEKTTLADAEHLPFEDKSFDVVYARHILEHLPYYENALTEMIRVASKEVIVIFFMPLDCDLIEIDKDFHVNNNHYDEFKLINFLMKNQRLLSISFKQVPDSQETILLLTLC